MRDAACPRRAGNRYKGGRRTEFTQALDAVCR